MDSKENTGKQNLVTFAGAFARQSSNPYKQSIGDFPNSFLGIHQENLIVSGEAELGRNNFMGSRRESSNYDSNP